MSQLQNCSRGGGGGGQVGCVQRINVKMEKKGRGGGPVGRSGWGSGCMCTRN